MPAHSQRFAGAGAGAAIPQLALSPPSSPPHHQHYHQQQQQQYHGGAGGDSPHSVSDVEDEDEDEDDCSASDDDEWQVPAAPAAPAAPAGVRVIRKAKRGGKQGAAAAGSRLLLSKLEKAGYRADVVKALAAANNNPDAAVRLVPAALVEAARGITRLEIERDGKFKATVDAAKILAGNCWLKAWAQLNAQLPAAVKGLDALAKDANGVFMTSIVAARAASKGCWITAWARLSKAKSVLEIVAKEEDGADLVTEALEIAGMDMCDAALALYKYKQQQHLVATGAVAPAAAAAC